MTKEEILAIAEQIAKDNAHLNETGNQEFMVSDWPESYSQERINNMVDNYNRGITHAIKVIEYNYKITKK